MCVAAGITAAAQAFDVHLPMRPVHKKVIAIVGLVTAFGAAWLAQIELAFAPYVRPE